MRIQIFTDSDDELLQGRINDWLKSQRNISVSYVTQSESFDGIWSLTISIFYEGYEETDDDQKF